MGQLELFLKTATYPKPGYDVPIEQFHQRVLGWLTANRQRHWTQRETSRVLAQIHDTFRGDGNRLWVCDVSFEPWPFTPNAEIVGRFLDHVRFIDSGIGYVINTGRDWERYDANGVRRTLAVVGAYAPESHALRQHARANPVSLSSLLRNA
jgi:hypothetical protein